MTRRNGFTLIELMIVIVVIGVLAAMMMFSSTEASDMARATKIISDLQMLKRAALAYYTDHEEEFRTSFNKSIDSKELKKYIGNSNDPELASKYSFVVCKNDWSGTSDWYVYYGNAHGSLLDRPGIRKRLEARAKSQGLLRDTGDLHFNKGGNWTANYAYDDDFIAANIYKADDGNSSKFVGLRIK